MHIGSAYNDANQLYCFNHFLITSLGAAYSIARGRSCSCKCTYVSGTPYTGLTNFTISDGCRALSWQQLLVSSLYIQESGKNKPSSSYVTLVKLDPSFFLHCLVVFSLHLVFQPSHGVNLTSSVSCEKKNRIEGDGKEGFAFKFG